MTILYNKKKQPRKAFKQYTTKNKKHFFYKTPDMNKAVFGNQDQSPNGPSTLWANLCQFKPSQLLNSANFSL